jgi:erythromycin esterase-like protein
VRDALPGSWERLFHELDMGNLFVDLRRLRIAWPRPAALLERAIGVIYRPDTERASHYFGADLPRQFDALLHYDHTRAVEPLERTAVWERGEMPETWPSAL